MMLRGCRIAKINRVLKIHVSSSHIFSAFEKLIFDAANNLPRKFCCCMFWSQNEKGVSEVRKCSSFSSERDRRSTHSLAELESTLKRRGCFIKSLKNQAIQNENNITKLSK